jgi:hypothetical protein
MSDMSFFSGICVGNINTSKIDTYCDLQYVCMYNFQFASEKNICNHIFVNINIFRPKLIIIDNTSQFKNKVSTSYSNATTRLNIPDIGNAQIKKQYTNQVNRYKKSVNTKTVNTKTVNTKQVISKSAKVTRRKNIDENSWRRPRSLSVSSVASMSSTGSSSSQRSRRSRRNAKKKIVKE